MKIELKLVNDLVPYARNARTHSDEQVGQLMGSLAEFGWTNPVLADATGIVAGHGRCLAAGRMYAQAKTISLPNGDLLPHGMVPVIDYSTLSKSILRNGVKDCLCADCGTEFTVRKDTKPIVCKRCTSVRGGNASALIAKSKMQFTQCKSCKKPIPARLGYTYCSIECRKQGSHEERDCKCCGVKFNVYKSAINGNTNASGNFCSRPCYEKWLCNSERVTGRGSQWLKIRTIAKNRHPFCALCSETKKLEVHHIASFRLSHDNGQDNLIPLCKKHHKIVETLTHEFEMAGFTANEIKLVMGAKLADFSEIGRYVMAKKLGSYHAAY